MWFEVQDKLAIKELWFAFMPSWFCRNYGITLGEKFIFDPDYRVKCYQEYDKIAAGRFAGLCIGSNDPKPRTIQPDFNNATVPAAAGCQISYPLDNYPWNTHLDSEKIMHLKPPEKLADIFPYSEIIRQVRYLNDKLGQDVKPWFPVRGVLNDAMLIQGSSFLEDFVCNPQNAQRLLDFTYLVLMMTVKENHFDLKNDTLVCLTNCTVMMVSPDMYRESFFGYDKTVIDRTAEYGVEFGIHHCGLADKYAAEYRKLGKISHIAIGWGSDIRLAMELFPDAKVQCLFSPTFLAGATRRQVRDKMTEILDAARGNLHRLVLEVSDIEYGTPEENLYEIFECCKRGL